MELDFGTLAIGVLAILACILPFALDYRSRKNKENYLLQPLKKIAQQQNCQISEYETGRNFAIGIDKAKKVSFSIKKKKKIQFQNSLILLLFKIVRLLLRIKQ